MLRLRLLVSLSHLLIKNFLSTTSGGCMIPRCYFVVLIESTGTGVFSVGLFLCIKAGNDREVCGIILLHGVES